MPNLLCHVVFHAFCNLYSLHNVNTARNVGITTIVQYTNPQVHRLII